MSARRLRYTGIALLILAVFVAAAAATIGKLPSTPVWAAAGVAGAAALVAGFLPLAISAVKERQKSSELVLAGTARLKLHLEAVQRRYTDHMRASGFVEAMLDEDSGATPRRLVRVRERPVADRTDRRDARRGELRVGVLEDFVERTGERVVVLGEGGLGKTTSLLRLAAEAAVRAERDSSAPIPVWIDLKNFDALEQGFERLFRMAANSMLGMDEQEFDSVWRLGSRRLLFLLDGMNEQRGSATACAAGLRELTNRAPHTYVIASRPTAEVEALTMSEEGFVVLDLLPLGEGDIRQILVGLGLGRLDQRMDKDLRGLARNPFMLVALARSCAALGRPDLPRNMGDLYRQFLDEYIFTRREPAHGLAEYEYLDVKKPVLARLAYRMTSTNVTVIRHDQGLERQIEGDLEQAIVDVRRLTTRRKVVPTEWDGAGFLAEVIANGILRSADERLEFMHESVQEYFTAVALADEPVEDAAGMIPELLWRHVEPDAPLPDTEFSFRTPVLMLSGLLEQSGQLVRALAPRNPLMAARCLATATRVDSATVAELQDGWLRLLERGHERYRQVGASCLGLAKLAEDRIVRRLIDVAADDASWIVRRSATDALNEVGLSNCVDHLAAKIGRPSPYDPLTKLLVKFAPTRAAGLLFERWLNASELQREELEELLGSIEHAAVADELKRIEHQALESGDASRVSACRAALESLPAWEDRFSKRLQFPRAEELREAMRKSAREAQEELSEATDVSLIEALQQRSDAYMRSAAAKALAERGRSDALPALIEALVTEPRRSMTRDDIARAAHRLGGDGVVDELIARVWHPRPLLFLQVARTSEILALDALPQAVMRGLEDVGLAVEGRGQVARQNGGWIITYDFLDHDGLVLTVDDAGEAYHLYVSDTATRCLDAAVLIGDPDRMFQDLVRAQAHDQAAVRASATELLEHKYTARAVEPISAQLEHETDPSVVETALVGLGRIGTTAALGVLFETTATATVPERTLRAVLTGLPATQEADQFLLAQAQREPTVAARSLVLEALASLRKHRVLTDPTARPGDDAPDFLIEAALTEGTPEARRAAAAALRWSAGDPGVRTFASELRSAVGERRAAAATALGVLQEDGSTQDLAALLDDNVNAVRVAAAASLLQLRAEDMNDQAASVLVDVVMRAGDPLVRESAADALRDDGADAVNQLVAKWIDAGRFGDVEVLASSLLEGERSGASGEMWLLWARALARENEGDPGAALSDLDTALATYDAVADIHATRARLLSALHRFDEAVAEQRRAVEMSSDDASLYTNLGWFMYLADDFDGSVRASQQALNLDAAPANAAFNLALAYLAGGHKREARIAHAAAIHLACAQAPEELEDVVQAVRQDFEHLRDRRPDLAAVIDDLEKELTAAVT